MLYDDFMGFKSGIVFPNGTSHDKVLLEAKKAFIDAQVFVLDRDAVLMACSVSMSRVSSILSAMPFARLPYPKTWIEWSTQDSRQAMAELGSPNRKSPFANERVNVQRVGFMLQELPGTPRRIAIDYVHRDLVDGSKPMTDLGPIRFIFTVPEGAPDRSEVTGEVGSFDIDSDITGKVRDHLKLLTNDPYEFHCDNVLDNAFRVEPQPLMTPVRAAFAQMAGEMETARVEINQGREAMMHMKVLIPALILMNAKNGVEVEDVPAPEKLNKQRLRSGKRALVAHRIVKLRLNQGNRARAARGSEQDRIVRGTLVRGHFRVRRDEALLERGGPQIWWVHAHPRRGMGAVTHSYAVTK